MTDVTTRTEDGRYRARAAIVWLDAGRTRSQRFLDLETFRTRFEAHAQVLAAAIAWIDAAHEELATPSGSGVLPATGTGIALTSSEPTAVVPAIPRRSCR